MDPSRFFDYSDTDKNGLVNILDVKIGLERLLQPDEPTFKIVIGFVKEVKNVFKTSDFSRGRFLLFMSDPRSSFVHRGRSADNTGYDVVRSSIEAIIKTPGELVDAVNKIKRLIDPHMANDIRLNQRAEKFDREKRGIMGVREFQAFLDSLKEVSLTEEQKTLVCNLADKDHDGQVRYDEFLLFVQTDVKVDQLHSSSK